MDLYKGTIEADGKKRTIVVCANDTLEAKALMFRHFPEQLAQYGCKDYKDYKWPLNDDVRLSPEEVDTLKIKKITKQKQLKDWWDAIPWGNEEFVDDRSCDDILADQNEVDDWQHLIGETIKSVNVSNRILIIHFSSGRQLHHSLLCRDCEFYG